MIKTKTGFMRAIIGMTLLMTFFAGTTWAQIYFTGTVSTTLIDSTRNNRAVDVEIMYPADQPGYNVPVAGPADKKYPVIVFGHSDMTPYYQYQHIWDFHVRRGFIVVMPKTEMSNTPDHDAFALDIAFLVNEFARMRLDPNSMFFKKYNGKSCAMGHGTGGGAATLAMVYNSNITTLVTLAATETTPSAIAAAMNVDAPALIFSAGLDCISPANNHQVPMYNNLASVCKAYVSVNNATHCHYAQNFGDCVADEQLCNGSTPGYLQTNLITNYLMTSWLRYWMKYNIDAFDRFELKLQSKALLVTYSVACNQNGPRESAPMDEEVLSAMPEVVMYPNPVGNNGNLNLEIPSEETGTATLMITNMLGQVQVNRTIELMEGTINTISIPMNGLSRGNYLVVLGNDEYRVTRALVVD